DVLAGWRERVVAARRNRQLDRRLLGVAAVFRGIERALHAVDVAVQPDTAGQRRGLLARIGVGEAIETRQRGASVIDFRQRAAHPDVLNAPEEVGRQMHRIDEAQQRALWIDTRDD